MKNLKDELKLEPSRDGFGKGLVEAGRIKENIVTLSADLSDSTRAGWFKKEFPDRFFNFGVAEQNMMSTAAGFALSGKIPYACTFGVFAAGRAWDQIRVSIDYMNLNVRIIGTHGGVSVGEDGHTHQAMEEITLMRVLPNMTMIVPCDSVEAKKATIKSAGWKGPVYIRLGRSPAPVLIEEKDPFEIGKGTLMKNGKDLTIIACGRMVYESMKAAEYLSKEGIDAMVINLHTLKPVDEKMLIKAAKKTGAVVTAEEHSFFGGLGSAVSEVLSRNYPVPIKMVGVRECGQSGAPQELFKYFNLQSEDIAKAARSALRMKSAKK
ncbi:MAG: transketolase family protein [Candidatus Omnitrophota bacterium]|nr:transketolase family protein [Candidatus Omnitrophota bacterium]